MSDRLRILPDACMHLAAHLQRQVEAWQGGVKGGHEPPQQHHVNRDVFPDPRPLHFQSDLLPGAAQPAPVHLRAWAGSYSEIVLAFGM